MPSQQAAQPITDPLPKGWKRSINSAVLQVIALAQFSLTMARGKLVGDDGVAAEWVDVDRLRQEVALLREEHRLLRTRFARLAPHKRPHYTAVERMAILELRAARGWTVVETARRFLVSPETISGWCRRIDEYGDAALVRTAEPVNRFPDFVRYAVRRLQVLCPALGSRKIAEVLCRAGLHLGATTVRRMLKETPGPLPEAVDRSSRTVIAEAVNDVWHVDLTTVPTGGGFWIPWLPFSLPQRWPFCWWVAVVVDQFSRRATGFAVFARQPTSVDVRRFLGCAIAQAGAAPDTIVTDQGRQFVTEGFKRWCRRRDIELRHGAVGKQGSIAVVERFIRTLKQEGTRRMLVAPDRRKMRQQLTSFITWYNHHRPHTSLDGKTPDEVYFQLRPANRRPRLEPRERWPRGSPCARPQTLVAGQPGDQFEMVIELHDGQRHLPVVSLKRRAA